MTGQQTARSAQLAEQASAMFDGELPAAECELLARRLSSDAHLQRQWSRHALIGAAMRGEPLAVQRETRVLQDSVAARVRAELNSDGVLSPLADSTVDAAAPLAVGGAMRWGRPLAGVGIAAGVAALSIFWVRGAGDSPAVAPAATFASNVAVVTEIAALGVGLPAVSAGSEVVLAAPSSLASNSSRQSSPEPESYVVPLPSNVNGSIASTQLANYVVAHSEFSGALTRRSALSALVTAEALPVVPEAAPAPVAGGR